MERSILASRNGLPRALEVRGSGRGNVRGFYAGADPVARDADGPRYLGLPVKRRSGINHITATAT